MALEDELIESEDEETLGDEEEKDLDIMVSMAQNMIDEAGEDFLEQAMASKDPGVVIGQFLMQLGSQLGEQLPFEISPRILLARGGWVEQISDYIQEEYGVPKKIMDRAEIFIGSSAQNMAQGQAQQSQEQAPVEQGAPVIPEGVQTNG